MLSAENQESCTSEWPLPIALVLDHRALMEVVEDLLLTSRADAWLHGVEPAVRGATQTGTSAAQTGLSAENRESCTSEWAACERG